MRAKHYFNVTDQQVTFLNSEQPNKKVNYFDRFVKRHKQSIERLYHRSPALSSGAPKLDFPLYICLQRRVTL